MIYLIIMVLPLFVKSLISFLGRPYTFQQEMLKRTTLMIFHLTPISGIILYAMVCDVWSYNRNMPGDRREAAFYVCYSSKGMLNRLRHKRFGARKGRPPNFIRKEETVMKRKALIALAIGVLFAVMTIVAAADPNVVSESVGSNYPFWDKVENGQGSFTPPEGSVTIVGKIIGGKFGWDDNPGTGAAQAFNGNLGDVYDMNENWDSGIVWDDQYAGIWADEPYILTCFRVLPTTDADWQAERLNLAAVQGSNDGVNWTTLYQFDHAATVGDTNFVEVTEFENNTGYTMFRYKRLDAHTDCRELEFYGYVVGSQSDSSPTTSDVIIISATVAFVSAIAVTFAVKRRKEN